MHLQKDDANARENPVPSNHGIYLKQVHGSPAEHRVRPEAVGIFRYGVHQIFRALIVTSAPAAEPRKAVQLEFHFREICQRLVFSVQHLNSLMQAMAAAYDETIPALRLTSLHLEAGGEADHILTYLNSIVDDVACAIGQVLGIARAEESMGKLKVFAKNKAPPALAPVTALLAELDANGSWWQLGFERKVGGRQLLIHNHHFVSFQGSSTLGEPMEVNAFLMAPFAGTGFPDFFKLLREIFASLCDWLDRLEAVLTAHIQATALWNPDARCHSFTLPVGYPLGTTIFDPRYFVLPLCNDSDPLPWTTTISPE